MIILHAAIQPYKKRVHNMIDLLLFFNLTLINGISLYNYITFVGNKNTAGVKQNGVTFWMILQLLLLFLPLVSARIIIIRKLMILVKNALTRGVYTGIQPITCDFMIPITRSTVQALWFIKT